MLGVPKANFIPPGMVAPIRCDAGRRPERPRNAMLVPTFGSTGIP